MYCPHCGSQIPDAASMCPACGVPLGNPYQSSMAGPGPVYPGPNVPSYLVPAILTTCFCCMPFGIVAIVYAAQVGSKLAAGDFEGARRSSDSARMWSWISAGVQVVWLIVVIAFVLAVGQNGR